MPELAIVMTTWFPPGQLGEDRCTAANAALRSWVDGFARNTMAVVIADDGTSKRGLLNYLQRICDARGIERPLVETPRLGCGGAMNAGLRHVFDNNLADVVFYGQDDWELTEPLDLAPSLALLNNGTADIVRLGPTHPNLRGNVVRTDIPGAEWCLEYDWAGGGYVFGMRPALYHRRVFDRFGYFAEGVSACEAERIYNEHLAPGHATISAQMPPRVFHAPNCTLAGPFRHIETIELGDDDPATLTERYRDG